MTTWGYTTCAHRCRHCETHRCNISRDGWPKTIDDTRDCTTCGRTWYAHGLNGWATYKPRPWKPGELWWGVA